MTGWNLNKVLGSYMERLKETHRNVEELVENIWENISEKIKKNYNIGEFIEYAKGLFVWKDNGIIGSEFKIRKPEEIVRTCLEKLLGSKFKINWLEKSLEIDGKEIYLNFKVIGLTKDDSVDGICTGKFRKIYYKIEIPNSLYTPKTIIEFLFSKPVKEKLYRVELLRLVIPLDVGPRLLYEIVLERSGPREYGPIIKGMIKKEHYRL